MPEYGMSQEDSNVSLAGNVTQYSLMFCMRQMRSFTFGRNKYFQFQDGLNKSHTIFGGVILHTASCHLLCLGTASPLAIYPKIWMTL